MSIAAALYREVRESERHVVALNGTLRDPEWRPVDVIVDDLSLTGFRAPAERGLRNGDLISLGLAGVGMCPARVVRRADGQIGCTFLVPLGPNELEAALNATSPRPIDLSRITNARLPEPECEPVPDSGARRFSRCVVIIGLAAASWAGLFGAASLLTK